MRIEKFLIAATTLGLLAALICVGFGIHQGYAAHALEKKTNAAWDWRPVHTLYSMLEGEASATPSAPSEELEKAAFRVFDDLWQSSKYRSEAARAYERSSMLMVGALILFVLSWASNRYRKDRREEQEEERRMRNYYRELGIA